MKELKHRPLSDVAGLTGTTVIYREVRGEPEYVVVCGECEEIKTIGLKEGMQAALRQFMRWHHEDRHENTADAQSNKQDVKE